MMTSDSGDDRHPMDGSRQAPSSAVFVETSARLHFGVLDLRGARGRWFGGVGAAAPEPTLLVSAAPADVLEVGGEAADRAAAFGGRFLAHYGVEGGARLHVHRALPAHAGLGSGTQLALAVARALAELHGIEAGTDELARAMHRARRSAVGTWTFAGGGLVVEGGRRAEYPDGEEVAPLLTRLAFPPSWSCVLAVPARESGMSGADETEALAQLPSPPERDVERVAHLVLMGLLPALADADLEAFGAALTEIQRINGRWFAPAQGGTFAPGRGADVARCLVRSGATGVGQSSWGPAVYGLVEGEEAAGRLADRIRGELGSAGRVYAGPFRSEGARVWRAPTEKGV